MALVIWGSLTSMVNLLIVPSLTRLETLRLTAASERSTLPATSTKETRESSRRSSSICASVLSRRLHLLGGDDPVQHLYDVPDLLLGDDERRGQGDDRPARVSEEDALPERVQEYVLDVHPHLKREHEPQAPRLPPYPVSADERPQLFQEEGPLGDRLP